MAKYDLIQGYYYLAAQILKDYIPNIPELKLTDAKGYSGRAYKSYKIVHTIALSKWNLYVRDMDREDVYELILVICHELAHTLFFDHSDDHTKTTDAFFRLVKSELDLKILKGVLESA